MPWCPRCDEHFPEGPACPRCSARLIQRETDSVEDTMESVPALRGMRVSRRQRRALERLSASPKGPSPRMLAIALLSLVFAVGFLLGRLAGVTQTGPIVSSVPNSQALAAENVEGSAAYLAWARGSVATVVGNDLYTGKVEQRIALGAPLDVHEPRTELVALQRSVAVVVSDGKRSLVAFAADDGPTHGWIAGVEAAWSAPDQLLVRAADGALTRWFMSSDDLHSEHAGHAEALWQTSKGAVVQRDGKLRDGSEALKEHGLDMPAQGTVLAISGDGKHAVVDTNGPALWDGTKLTPVKVNAGYKAVGASFAADNDRAAIVVKREGDLALAVSAMDGSAALRSLDGDTSTGCTPTPVWDARGNWVYLSTGSNGQLSAAPAGGSPIKRVRTQGVGCGLAWIP